MGGAGPIGRRSSNKDKPILEGIKDKGSQPAGKAAGLPGTFQEGVVLAASAKELDGAPGNGCGEAIEGERDGTTEGAGGWPERVGLPVGVAGIPGSASKSSFARRAMAAVSGMYPGLAYPPLGAPSLEPPAAGDGDVSPLPGLLVLMVMGDIDVL